MCNFPPFPPLGGKATLDFSQRYTPPREESPWDDSRKWKKEQREEKAVTTCGGMARIGVDDNNPSVGKLFSYVRRGTVVKKIAKFLTSVIVSR